jgi:hypothetical protein
MAAKADGRQFEESPAMRSLLAALMTALFPVFAFAQEAKPIPLSDYIPFCFALWADAPDISAKANTLGLKNAIDPAGSYSYGKSTSRFYNGVSDIQRTVNATTTKFADGKELDCEIVMPSIMNRAELETLEQTVHLDGQIIIVGSSISGQWKIPDRSPPVLLRANLVGGHVLLGMQEFEAGR